jgi:hypothetical protein
MQVDNESIFDVYLPGCSFYHAKVSERGTTADTKSPILCDSFDNISDNRNGQELRVMPLRRGFFEPTHFRIVKALPGLVIQQRSFLLGKLSLISGAILFG